LHEKQKPQKNTISYDLVSRTSYDIASGFTSFLVPLATLTIG